MKIYLAFWCFLQLLSTDSFSQLNPALDNFEVFTINNKVALRWTMKPGYTCLGIGILRSTDNKVFNEIGIIGGVCGSPDQAITYTFIDSFPVADRGSYYKLILGLLGESQTVYYRFIDFTKQKALITPNPMKRNGMITFSPEPVEEALVCLYSAEGSLLYSEKIRQTDHFIMSDTFGKSGTTFFSVTTLSGKIISTGSFVLIE